MDPLHRELIQQAVDAARSGERDKAFELLEQVLQEDEENTTAWFMLARLTTNNDERRMALTTILQLEPDHQKAREMLDKMGGKGGAASPDAEVIPGVPRRLLRLILAGVGGFVVLLILGALLIINNNNQRQADEEREGTRSALALTYPFLTATQASISFTETAVAGTATQIALVSPTPSPPPTSRLPTLPPTPTNTPEPSPTPTLAPLSLPGTILGWGGPDLGNTGALTIQSRPLSGAGDFTPLPLEEGRRVSSTLDGQIIAYSQYLNSQSRYDAVLYSADGGRIPSILDEAASIGGYLRSNTPSLSTGATRIAFVGYKLDTDADELFVAVISGDPIVSGEASGEVGSEEQVGAAVVQLTNDGADYSFPSISPDGTRVVAVRTEMEGETPGQDIVMIDVTTLEMRPLTTNGFGIEETMPKWSPVGNLITYAAQTQENPSFDIYLTSPDRVDGGFLVGPAASDSDEMYPVFSPDGNFLAFASNRGRSFDIYIVDLNAQQLYQFTDDEDDVYPGTWIR